MTILASLLLAAGTAEVPKAASLPFETEVLITPSTQDAYMLLNRATPFTYTCEASAVATSQRFSIGRLIVSPGASESAVTKWRGYDYRFTVKIDKDARSARWVLAIEQDGKAVSTTRSTVWLQKVDRY